MKSELVKENKVNFLELAHKDYHDHVDPIYEEKKRTEQVIRELCDLHGKLEGGVKKERIAKAIDELREAQPKIDLEYQKMSTKHNTDINLVNLGMELEGLEIHNATVAAYMKAEKIIEKELLPIAFEINQMYKASSTPLLVYKIGQALNVSRQLKMKDRAELEKKFYDRYNQLEAERQKESDFDNKYRGILDDILKKYTYTV